MWSWMYASLTLREERVGQGHVAIIAIIAIIAIKGIG